MQMLYSSSSSVRPVSDICVSIGCSSTFLKQLYCQFSILILDFVSGKTKLLSPSCVWIISCQWLYWSSIYCTEKIRKIQIGPKTIKFWKLKKRPCFLSICSQEDICLRDDISWEINSPSPRWRNHGNWGIIFIPWSLLFYFMQRQVLEWEGNTSNSNLSRCPFQAIP